VDLLDAAIAGDDALARALGHPVVPGWATFTTALARTRDELGEVSLTKPGGCVTGLGGLIDHAPASIDRPGWWGCIRGRVERDRSGEIVRRIGHTSGEARGKPTSEGTCLQGEVVSRTYPRH
jgi:hypothetical protein